MDFWDGWKQLSIMSFGKPEATNKDVQPGSGAERSGKASYPSNYGYGYGYSTSSSFTDQTLVFEALALCSPLKDFLVEELHDRSKMARWIDAVDETKKLRITSLDQLEVDRDYKTEQGIPIKRLPTNEIDLAGKILLKIHPQQDAKPGLTVLKAYFAEGTGRIAIESFSLLKFDEGVGIVEHRKDSDHKLNPQDICIVFSLEEIPLDQKFIVTPRERKSEMQAGERRIKIKRISVRDVYISYRHKELVLGGKMAGQGRSGVLGPMVGVLSRDIKLNFQAGLGAGAGSLALCTRKKIDFSSMAEARSSPSLGSSSSGTKADSKDCSSPVGSKRKLDDKENEVNGTSSPSRGSPARHQPSGSPAKKAKVASPLRAKVDTNSAHPSSPLASTSASSAAVAAPARVARKPRPSVSMGGLLDLLPTPPGSPSTESAPSKPSAPSKASSSTSSSASSSASVPSASAPQSSLATSSAKPAAQTNTTSVGRRQPLAPKSVKPMGSTTQGLKDLFAPAAPASGSSSSASASSAVSSSSATAQAPAILAGPASAVPFAYIPYANIDPSVLAKAAALTAAEAAQAAAAAAAPLPPPPPPPMLVNAKREGLGGTLRKKMKTLHWSIIPKDKLNDTVWKAPEMVDSPGIDLDTNELESMFSVSPEKKKNGEGEEQKRRKRGGISGKKHSPLVDLLNIQRINNIGILLSQFKVPLEDVVQAIWQMDESALSLENLKALRYIAPKEDEIKILKTVANKLDMDLLTKAERFLLMLVEVPRLSQRLESFLWKRQFPTLLAELAADTACLLMACDEVKNAKMLPQILKIVLTIGQVLNRDSYLWNSDGFKLESLMRLTETRGKNSKFTILHFLKKEVQTKKSHLLGFYDELPHVERASKLCMEHIMLEVQKIKKDLAQIERELALRREEERVAAEQDGGSSELNDRYGELMGTFYEDAKQQADRLAVQVESVLTKWKELARFYGEDAEKTPPQQFFSCLHHFASQFHSLQLPASFLEGKGK